MNQNHVKPPTDTSPERAPPMVRRRGGLIKPRAIFIAIAIICAIALVVFLINPLGTASMDPRGRIIGFIPMKVPADSMAPTLRAGDLIVVSTWAYARAEPKPGDVIVFKHPAPPFIPYVKRLVAMGGSTVEIVDGVTLVDGIRSPEPWRAKQPYETEYSLTMAPVEVPAGHFFVMGDNRDNSSDSRDWGFVPRTHLVGKVMLRAPTPGCEASGCAP